MQGSNICYAQSGGPTAVINATAAAVIKAADKNSSVFVAKNGILGVLHEDLFETWHESKSTINALTHTPGSAFGSCRFKLPHPSEDIQPYERLRDVFLAHNIRYFLYNGGNDSADTSLKISSAMKTLNCDLACVGIPKTIDNDLPATDCCPGFGSVAKYVAISVSEILKDLAAMARTSTKVFVLEVMGRHAGWIAAAAGLVREKGGPIIIIFPEVPFNPPAFIATLKKRVSQHGHAIVIVSEGAKDSKGDLLLATDETTDQFQHKQLGGVASIIVEKIKRELGYKCHFAVADYLQRSARHIASKTDLLQAQAVGKAAVEMVLSGKNGVMPVIWRISDNPYQWEIGKASLGRVANRERKMPSSFISQDRFYITSACRRYLLPLINGEAPQPYKEGLPVHAKLKNQLAKKKLPPYNNQR